MISIGTSDNTYGISLIYFRVNIVTMHLHKISIVAHTHMISIGTCDNTSAHTSTISTVAHSYIILIGLCDNTNYFQT